MGTPDAQVAIYRVLPDRPRARDPPDLDQVLADAFGLTKADFLALETEFDALDAGADRPDQIVADDAQRRRPAVLPPPTSRPRDRSLLLQREGRAITGIGS
jgi:hypothetical protein